MSEIKIKTKICSKCSVEKDVSAFHRNRCNFDGLQVHCKDCRRRQSTVDKEFKANNLFNLHMRECSLCGIIKPISEFLEATDKKSGYRSQCKDCLKIYYKKNIKKISQKNRKRRNNNSKCKKSFKQIPITDNPRINKNGFIEVDCYFCHEPFMPTCSQISNRLSSLNGNKSGENNMYCSDTCCSKCPTYNFNTRSIDPKSNLYTPKTEAQNARAATKTVVIKKAMCEKYGELRCEICGQVGEVELHHTLPVAQFGMESVNPDSFLMLCHACHVKLHGECK